MRHIREKLTFHPIHAQKLGGKSFQFLRPLDQTTRLPPLMPKDEAKTEYGCKGDYPPDETSPVIEPDPRKEMH